MDPRLYQFLKYTAIVLALGWLAWGIYDGFFKERAPGDTEYHAANKLFEDAAYARALSSYEAALGKDPRHIHAMRGRARSLMQLDRFEDALKVFDESIALEPNFAGTYANRGILHDRMGHHELALQDYVTALQLDPEITEGPHWLTRFLRNQPERPPGIAERAAYIAAELAKPESDRLLKVPEIDAEQRSYKK
ncbi:MAG: tetratricopeptide repeat protein [Acidiferrobacterales bacterium]|nr:tetratricopeptide repeat protein [Acidiferrobacterales bacterium]